MRLAVLASPDLYWLTTESEKAAFFTPPPPSQPADRAADAPEHGTAPGPVIDFADNVPIGVDQSGRAVLLYLASVPWTEEFRRFLQRHVALFQVAPAWTLRLVFPRPIDGSYGAYQTVIREELETPLQPATILELKSYFEHRRAAGDSPRQRVTERFLDRGLELFSALRFTSLYRRWLKHGDAVFETLSSPVIAEDLATGRGRVECVVLPHTYRHLSPLVNEGSEPPERIEKGLRSGNREGNRPAHALNPGAQPGLVQSELTVSEQLDREWHRLNDWYNERKKLRLTP
jgi:hypothetical protein